LLQLGATARFYPEGTGLALKARVSAIDTTRTVQLAYPMLDTRYGGPITTEAGERTGQPTGSLYRVRLEFDAPLAEPKETRGRIHIDGPARSLAWEALKSAAAVLIRESGF
jgi:putative peptide zinc metalloprotease protein